MYVPHFSSFSNDISCDTGLTIISSIIQYISRDNNAGHSRKSPINNINMSKINLQLTIS